MVDREVSGCFEAFGTIFRLRASTPDLMVSAVQCAAALNWVETAADADVDYQFCWRPASNEHVAPSFELVCNGVALWRTLDIQDLFERFLDHAKLQTATLAKGTLFIHAGVVCWKGCAIVVPASSGAGKTTLVRRLIEAGAEYYSDEFAPLDLEGRVHPYPLPLSIRGSDGRPTRLRGERLGASIGTAAVPVSLILITEYRQGSRWRPRTLSKAEALLALMEHTVAAREAHERALLTLRQTVLGATAIRSSRGEAQALARWVLDRIP